jgi:hypothetical protein
MVGIRLRGHHTDNLPQSAASNAAYPFYDGQALVEGSLNTWRRNVKGIPKHYLEEDKDFQSQSR